MRHLLQVMGNDGSVDINMSFKRRGGAALAEVRIADGYSSVTETYSFMNTTIVEALWYTLTSQELRSRR